MCFLVKRAAWPALLAGVVLVSACGGGASGPDAPAAGAPTIDATPAAADGGSGVAAVAMSTRDATRLADQASFGSNEALVASIRAQGAAAWVASQMALAGSSYTSGGGPEVHQNALPAAFCDLPPHAGPTCWRDNLSTEPLVWDFYRNAIAQPDQLRQRVAFALQQLVVVSGVEVDSTYGMRNYHNALLQNAFGNYRQVLKKVATSPVMGDYLNNANNDKAAPNENFARELLQLFSIGNCLLNADGSLQGGKCAPTHTNETVRAYAYALTGWTYPAGGASAWGCWPAGTHCRFHGGDMVPAEAYHDTAARTLLAGVALPAGHKTDAALERVLDSLMAHPNMPPFIGKRLIQHLVSSNPSPAYVTRVATAFATGSYSSGGRTFGAGQRGDLAAAVAAVLLDAEARGDVVGRNAGKLREPVLLFTGVLRALGGRTDGAPFAWWWGEALRQHHFRPPSVFNFYPSDFPVAGTQLVGPAFGLHNASSALQRLNYLVYLLDWDGSDPSADVPRATGTKVDLSGFVGDAPDAARLVDRLATIAIGQPLPAGPRAEVIKAVSLFNASNDPAKWQVDRARTAAYLVFASPQYQVQR
jgi:uncharacterized protein (DUF1800 family)